MLERKTKNILG